MFDERSLAGGGKGGILSTTRAAAAALALILLALTTLFVVNHLGAEARARYWIDHTHAVIEANNRLLLLVEQDVSAGRGFLLNRQTSHLGPYVRAQAEIDEAQARLAALVADNPAEFDRVNTLNALIDRRVQRMDDFVRLGTAGDFAGAGLNPNPTAALALEDAIRDRSASISAEERDLLVRREASGQRSEKISLALGLAVAGLALTGLLAFVFALTRANRRLVAALSATETAQSAQRAGQALIDAIFAHTPDYLYVLEVTPEGRFVVGEINPAFAKALNVQPADLKGRAIDEMLGRRGSASLLSHYRQVIAADRPVLTRDSVPGLPEGPRVWESIMAPVRNEAGVIDRIIGSTRDITERVMTEERLAEAQRMESVGQLTGGVAHDFNNLLQVIRGNLELLESAVPDDDRAQRAIRNAIHGADRAAQLTRQLLAFARRQPLDPQVVNLSRLVGDMAELLRRTLGETIEVETVVGGGLWNTLADAAQVESAILNLALNARDAMLEGGRLTIEVTNAALDEAYVREAPEVAAGQYVMLAVSDTGAGMSAEIRKRVFDPFFTTKSDGKGSGLGLSMVYGFVRQSSGHVRIYSEVGQGTTVKIYLPRSRQALRQVAEAEAAEALGANQTILVVEDEGGVRAAAVAMLEDLGYRCREAADGAAALEVLREGADVDLVFTDVVMPGPLSCRELIAAIAKENPDLPVLFTSGYTENAIVHHGRLDEGVSLLSKPYSRDELARKVAGLLRREATAAAIARRS